MEQQQKRRPDSTRQASFQVPPHASGKAMLKRFISYYGPQKHLFFGDMFCALLVAAIDLAFPQILRGLTNGLFKGPAAEIYHALLLLLLGLVLMYAVRYACRYFVGAWGHIMGARMENRMRADLFAQYERFSFSYYDRVKTGDMMSRIVNDLFDIAEAAHHGPENIIISAIEIVGMLIIMMLINWQLALALTLVTVLVVLYLLGMNRRLRATFHDNRVKISGINSQLEDSLQGMRVIKSFTAEQTEHAKFERTNNAYLASKTRTYRAMGTFTAASSTMSGMLYTVVIVLGGWLVASDLMDVSDLAIFALYISILSSPIETLINFTEMFQKATAGFRRFCEILDTKPGIADKPGAPELGHVRGDIDFDNVSFSYDGEHDVLKNVTLHIPAGKTFALVGPSGSGKTTLCSLLPRFYDVRQGGVRIDGTDVRNVTQESLRRSIGLVQQDVYLFDGSIGENIAYGSPDATLDEIIQAAKLANIHDFVAGLPAGYDTVVGERGALLSGGQKQRISIARIFLKDPDIIILDEATSALDNESERAVQESLARLSQDRTTLIIAHRLSTIKNAQTIVAMDQGRVAQVGTHEELLAQDGIYARYYRMQFEGTSAAADAADTAAPGQTGPRQAAPGQAAPGQAAQK